MKSHDRTSDSLITVIIPCYQQGRWLHEAVDSVLSQTDTPAEIVVVNDGSDDDTDAVANSYGTAIRYLRQENAGPCAARNVGAAKARGEYLLFLDADDYLYPGSLRSLRDAFREHPGASVSCGLWDLVSGTGETIARKETPPDVTFETLLTGNQMPLHVAMMRAQAFTDVSGFSDEVPWVEDWDLWLRIARTGGQFVTIPHPVAAYRIHDAGRSRNWAAMLDCEKRIYEKLEQPDDRIRITTEAECLTPPRDVLQNALQLRHWFYLGVFVGEQNDEQLRQVMKTLQPSATQKPDRVFPLFMEGIRAGTGMDDAELSEGFASFMEQHIGDLATIESTLCPGITARLVDRCMSPLRNAVDERDTLRASTSYRLGRMITQLKFW